MRRACAVAVSGRGLSLPLWRAGSSLSTVFPSQTSLFLAIVSFVSVCRGSVIPLVRSILTAFPSPLLFYLPSSAMVGIEGGPGRFLGGRARPEELVAAACVELCASSATCVGSGTAWDSQTRHGRRFFLPSSIAVSYEGRGWSDAPAQGTTMPSGTRGGVVSGARGDAAKWRRRKAQSCRVRSSQCAADLLTSPFVRLVLERPRFRCLGAAALAVEVPGLGVHVQEPPGWREVAPTRGAVSGAG